VRPVRGRKPDSGEDIILNLGDLLTEDLIHLDIKARAKNEAIREVAEVMSRSKQIFDREEFLNALLEREGLATTGIGRGIAFPHARSASVDGIVVALARSDHGIEFDSLDGKPVHLMFMMGTSPECVEDYLKVLARISRLLKKDQAKDALLTARTPAEVLAVVREIEGEIGD